jgi:outer membrane protein assembly factor BamB
MNALVRERWMPWPPALPVVLVCVAVASIAVWLMHKPSLSLARRVPGTDQAPGEEEGQGKGNPVLSGQVLQAEGQPSDLPGAWPKFRGANHDGISIETVPLARSWDSSGPRQLWSVKLGEGYAGAAVLGGRVYLMDYDQEKRQDALRCLSLGDGKEIWRFAYPVSVKRNHGMSRTVPTVTDKLVVAMGPKCHVVCLDAKTGQLRWGLDLVQEYQATVPPWYAGQCLLIDDGKVILAPGGANALLLAVDGETGQVLWRTPNPKGWKMTHSSITPMDFAGQRTYVYCANLGVVGVSAKDGSLLWQTPDWKISIANIPSPVILDEGRIFLSGGYNAGSLMLQVQEQNGQWTTRTLFKLDAETFGATQQTPIYYNNHIYGVRPDGQLACLDPKGQVVWTSGPEHRFGLGPFLIAQGVIFAMDDSGKLSLAEASPAKYVPLAQAKVLEGQESWGPLALAGGRLLARDLTKMVCLDVARR